MNNHSPLPDPSQANFELPMVYVKKQLAWEYKQVVRDLSKEAAPTEDELNVLGADGWELAGLIHHKSLVYFYFKRASG